MRISIDRVSSPNHRDLLNVQHTHLKLHQASNERSHSHGKDRTIVSRGSRDITHGRSRRRSRRRRRSNQRRASLSRRRSPTGSDTGAGVRRAQVGRDSSVRRLDAGVVARLIGVPVRGSRGVVDDIDRLNVERERTFGVVSLAAGPLDRTLGVIWVAAGPDADADAHGRLGVVCAVDGIGVLECAHDDAVQEPLDALGGPVD